MGRHDGRSHVYAKRVISSKGKQDGLYRHALDLNNRRKLARRAMRWLPHAGGKRTQCMYPLAPACITWHTFPNIRNQASCDRAREPGANESGLSWDQVLHGFVLVTCGVSTGIGAFVLVTQPETSALGMAETTTGAMACSVDAWDQFMG